MMIKCLVAVCVMLGLARVNGMSHTTFCMVTARRKVSYLEATLESYERERVRYYDGVGLIVVDVNNSSSDPSVYKLPNRTIEECDKPDVEGLPSCKTRQSTLDITASLLLCARYTSGWVVLVEDDNTLCGGGLDEIVTTLGGLDARDVALAKFSPASTGMSIPVSRVEAFVSDSLKRLETYPHDLTWVDDWNGGKGGLYHHERCLFQHIGTVSTQEYRNSEEFRAKYSWFRDYVCYQGWI